MSSQAEEQYQQMQIRLMEAQKNNAIAQQGVAMFNQDDVDKANLMEQILNPDKILERIGRNLRQARKEKDENGNMIWAYPPKEERILNETGVNAILEILGWYINHDVILSNYTIEEVREIVLHFGNEFSDLVFNNMELFGMDTRIKQRYYPIICTNVVNIVQSTYHRSIGGKALEAMNKSVMVTQSEPIGQNFNPIQQNKKFSIIHPSTWKG